MEKIAVYITVRRKKQAEKIADTLVELRLAAGASIIKISRSVYRWKGKIEKHGEWLLILRTVEGKFALIEEKVKEMHDYEVPEITAAPLVKGNQKFFDWIERETSGR